MCTRLQRSPFPKHAAPSLLGPDFTGAIIASIVAQLHVTASMQHVGVGSTIHIRAC
jgi:hypothetical protein